MIMKRIVIISIILGLLMSLGVMSSYAQVEKTRYNHVVVSGQRINMPDMPAKMSDIYFRMYQERLDFEVCKIVIQDDGARLVVAVTHVEDTVIQFAILADYEDGEIQIRETPTSTCTCTGTCYSGCDPEFIATTGKWICTKCEESNQIPNCKKTVTETHPGTNE